MGDSERAATSSVMVRPVRRLPVSKMSNRLAGSQLLLADGSMLWSILGNISVNDPRSTKNFLTVSIHRQGKWFDLARYHDVDFVRRGGTALARFLGKNTQDVFPMRYDIRELASGSAQSLSGTIDAEPTEPLSQDELIRLSMQAE